MDEEQKEAIRNAWLDLAAFNMHAALDQSGDKELGELYEASNDSVRELEQAFPFLLHKEDE